MTRLALILTLLTTAAHADGLSDIPDWTDPCAEPIDTPEQHARMWFGDGQAEGYAMYLNARNAACGDAPAMPVAVRYAAFSDEYKVAFVFPGDDRNPAPIPLPASGWLMLIGVLALKWRLKKW